jgi:hypothetical protein
MTSSESVPGYVTPDDSLMFSPSSAGYPSFTSWFDAVIESSDIESLFAGVIPGTMRSGWIEALGSFEAVERFLFEFYITTHSLGLKRTLLEQYMLNYNRFSERINAKVKNVWRFVSRSQSARFEQQTSLVLLALCFPEQIKSIVALVLPDGYDLRTAAFLLRQGVPVEAIPYALAEGVDASLMASLSEGGVA